MDAQSRVGETATLVALVQSTARLELEEGYASERASALDEILAENRFLAARDDRRRWVRVLTRGSRSEF